VLAEAAVRADAYAAMMPIEDRRQIIAVVDSVMPQARNESVRARFRQIRAAMGRTDCGTLCAF